jgi:hypothetical protein
MGLIVLVSVAVAMLLWLASIASPKTTLGSFIIGFITLAGPHLGGVILIQGPTIWFCLNTLRRRPAVGDRAWLAVAIAGWVAIQIAIVAYGRGTAIGSRYVDLLLPVYLVAFAAVFTLADAASSSRLSRYAMPGAVTWMFTVVAALMAWSYYYSLQQAIDWSKSASQQMINAQAYMSTRDVNYLKVKNNYYLVDLTFPDPAKLAHILDDPDVRSIMPPQIRPIGADNAGARGHMWLRGSLASGSATAVRGVLAVGPALLAMGVGLFFAVATQRTNYDAGPAKVRGYFAQSPTGKRRSCDPCDCA